MLDHNDATAPDQYDEYLTMKTLLPRGDGYQWAVITYQKRDLEGNLVRKQNEKLLSDTRVYTTDLPDE